MAFLSFDGGYYDGDIMGGVAHGYGEIYYDNGNSYRGEWKNGKFHGHGTYYNANGNRYVGEFAHDERHGNGTMYFANGSRCEGRFSYDHFVHGTYYFNDGFKQYGDWDEDYQPHGKSKLYAPDGSVYEGTFNHGKWHGTTTINYVDGRKVVSTFVNGQSQGASTTFYPFLKIKATSTYKDGERISPTVYYDYNGNVIDTASIRIDYPDGAVYVGEIKDGKKQGKGIYFMSANRYYVGTFDNDHIHGSGTMYYDNGKRFEGNWQHGKTHGKGVWYFINGTKRTAEYDNGKQISLGDVVDASVCLPKTASPKKTASSEGNVKKSTTAELNTPPKDNVKNNQASADDQSTIEYPDGKYVGKLHKGKRQGFATMYYADGWYAGDWKNDKKHGKGTMYYTDLSYYDGEWENDEMHGEGTLLFPIETVWKNKDGSEIVIKTGCKLVGVWKKTGSAKKLTLVYPDGTQKPMKMTDGNLVEK